MPLNGLDVLSMITGDGIKTKVAFLSALVLAHRDDIRLTFDIGRGAEPICKRGG
jgi:hypothetical protein